MSSSNILINDSDIFICEAFKKILDAPPAQMEEKLGSQARLAIASFLTQLPPADQLNASIMANHITAFCEPNKILKEWLKKNYLLLNKDGITKIVKTNLDPGDEADAPPVVNADMLANKGRDICQDMQRWAAEFPSPSNQGNQNESKSN